MKSLYRELCDGLRRYQRNLNVIVATDCRYHTLTLGSGKVVDVPDVRDYEIGATVDECDEMREAAEKGKPVFGALAMNFEYSPTESPSDFVERLTYQAADEGNTAARFHLARLGVKL